MRESCTLNFTVGGLVGKYEHELTSTAHTARKQKTRVSWKFVSVVTGVLGMLDTCDPCLEVWWRTSWSIRSRRFPREEREWWTLTAEQ